jgi:hypothetical protein
MASIASRVAPDIFALMRDRLHMGDLDLDAFEAIRDRHGVDDETFRRAIVRAIRTWLDDPRIRQVRPMIRPEMVRSVERDAMLELAMNFHPKLFEAMRRRGILGKSAKTFEEVIEDITDEELVASLNIGVLYCWAVVDGDRHAPDAFGDVRLFHPQEHCTH